MKNAFDIQDLTVRYGENEAIKNVSIPLNDRSITALIGPSGCGKSTFLRTLNRMNDLIRSCSVEGTVRYQDQDIYDESYDVIELRKAVGMVFQNPNPFPMSIYDNVVYGPRRQGVKDKKTLDNIMERSLKQAALYDEVKDRLEKSAMSLSGGQQQRLCIARALAMDPSVILMDEPTSALDPVATQKIEDLLTDLKKDYTIVIVTHSMHQAARISDYTAFFYMGELIEFDKTDTLFSVPKNKRTEAYITGRFG
ncbi:MAG: phosphate ABC transporter ATP-binding protein PstB [Bacillota bacterium]